MKSGFLAGLVLLGAAAGALAQDAKPTEPADQQEEARTEPVRKIKVLQDPHDIASFYRSQQAPAGGWFGYGDAAPLGKVSENPYAIAGYYRNHQRPANGYSQFWVNGYGGSYNGARGRRSMFGRRIGANGDLFLIAPTLFAPVGPLTGWFGITP
ncbi:MAG TPA: hypothetical protein VFO31_24775 [Vicinamibacterales bacterium]|nr:hypothetical protein [Vicinamibacterales bacterium]